MLGSRPVPIRSQWEVKSGNRPCPVFTELMSKLLGHLGDPLRDSICSRFDRVGSKVGVPGSGLYLCVTKQFSNHRQALAYQQATACKGNYIRSYPACRKPGFRRSVG